ISLRWQIRSAAPAWLVAEPGGEALVVRAVVLFERLADRVGHRRARPGAGRVERRMARVRQAEEVQNLVVDAAGAGEEFTAVDDVDPVPPDEPVELFELLRGLGAGPVGERPPVVPHRPRGRGHYPRLPRPP